MRALLLASLAMLALAFPSIAGDSAVVHYRLENGLEVVLAPDRRVPKVVFNLGYRVGSLNEPPGRSGFAHLFEHLMFAGTPAYPDIDAAYGALGVSINAWTFEDRTLYYAEGLASTLPYMLALEADRMANQGMAITVAELDVQRAVVLNEMRQNVLDSMAGAGWVALRSALFPADHPYHRPVLGSMADLRDASIEDVHGFFATYYVPNNAILTLVGDFDVAEARSLIEATFALVPRGADVPRPEAVPITPTAARVALEDAAPSPIVGMAWVTPPYVSADNGALRLAAELIGNYEYGLLREALINKGLASNLWVWLERGALGGRFIIEVAVSDGVEPEAAEAAVREALAAFAANPINPADLDRARRKLQQDDRLRIEPLKARAEELVIATDLLGRPQTALAADADLAAATAEDVTAAVTRHLDLADASVMFVRPGSRGGYPAVLTESSGTPQRLTAARRDNVPIPPLAAGEPVPAELPLRQEARLSNGIGIVHYPMPGAVMTYVAAAAGAGTTSAPEGKEGIIELAASMGSRGAGSRDFSAFAKAAKDLDADISAAAGRHAAFLYLSVPAANLSAAVPLLADAVRAPRFDARDWEAWQDETLFELARNNENIEDIAGRVAEAQLFPKQPGLPANDRSIASVRGISREEAQALFPRLFAPANLTFYSVGPMPVEAVAAELETAFGDWQSDAEPLAPRPRAAADFPDQQKVVFVAKPGASQSVVLVASPAPGLDEPGGSAAAAIYRLLGNDFISRINSVIREAKGYSYGTAGKLLDDVRIGSAMTIDAPVERDHTADALNDMLAGYATLVSAPVRPDEVQRTVTETLTTMAGTAETGQGLFETIREALSAGMSLEERHEQQLAVAALDVESVRTVASDMANLDRALIIVIGDPESVLPQLEQMGLEPVEVDAADF